jgi:hypothetical protein
MSAGNGRRGQSQEGTLAWELGKRLLGQPETILDRSSSVDAVAFERSYHFDAAHPFYDCRVGPPPSSHA